MKERHSNHTFGLRLFISLPNEFYIKEPVHFSLSSPVPCHSRYRLVNLEYLRYLASTSLNVAALKHLLPHCYELRGFPEARGVYISTTHLEVIAERLGLHIDTEYEIDGVDKPLENYTYQEWYLLAPKPMFKIFPVRRATGQVLTSPSTYTHLPTFLEDHFEAKSYLDSQVIHDPEKLFAADGLRKCRTHARVRWRPRARTCSASGFRTCPNPAYSWRSRKRGEPRPTPGWKNKKRRGGGGGTNTWRRTGQTLSLRGSWPGSDLTLGDLSCICCLDNLNLGNTLEGSSSITPAFSIPMLPFSFIYPRRNITSSPSQPSPLSSAPLPAP